MWLGPRCDSHISPALPLVFTRGQKVRNMMARFSTQVAFEALRFRNGVTIYRRSRTFVGSTHDSPSTLLASGNYVKY